MIITGMLLIVTFLLEKISLILVFTLASVAIALLSFLFEKKLFIKYESADIRQAPVLGNTTATFFSKNFFKEIKYSSSEWLLIIPVLMMVSFIPWGSTIKFLNQTIDLQIAKINSGTIYIVGLLCLCIPGILRIRSAGTCEERISQNIHSSVSFICFESSFALSVISLIMVSGSTRLEDIVNFQKDANWYILYQPLGFMILLVSSVALTSIPFSSMKYGKNIQRFNSNSSSITARPTGEWIGNHLLIFILCTVIVTFYFGGYDLPAINDMSLRNSIGVNKTALLEEVVFFLKIFIFIFITLCIQRIMRNVNESKRLSFGLKILLPISMLNLLLTGIIIMIK